MGLLKHASLRLLREEKWPSVEMLAQELYAVLQSDGPLTINGPLTIVNTGDTPALDVQQDSNLPPIVVQRGSDPFNYEVPVLMPPDTSGGDDSSATFRLVTIRQVRTDTLVVDDPADDSFTGAFVAKPYNLRKASPLTFNLTYSKAGEASGYTLGEYLTKTCQVRSLHNLTIHGTIDTDYQLVTPLYLPGQQMVIAQVAGGVVDPKSSELTLQASVAWIDLNVDGRKWAFDIFNNGNVYMDKFFGVYADEPDGGPNNFVALVESAGG